MLVYFGYEKQVVQGNHNLYMHQKGGKSWIMFAPLRANAIVHELTLSGITKTMVYSKVATWTQVDNYINKIEDTHSKKSKSKKYFNNKKPNR